MCEERNKVEFTTLNYNHQLMNLQAVVCKSGIENVSNFHFQEIIEEHPEILDNGIIFGALHKQCASLPSQLFSEVELKLIGKKDAMKHFSYAWLEIDTILVTLREISPDDRINNLWAFYAYLTKDIDWYISLIFPVRQRHTNNNLCWNMLSLYSVSIFSSVCESFFNTVSRILEKLVVEKL